MTEIVSWVFRIMVSSRSGKKRLYLTGTWPDGSTKTSSAITTVKDNGTVQTHSGSIYILKGPDRFGRSVEEAFAACVDWVPAGQ